MQLMSDATTGNLIEKPSFPDKFAFEKKHFQTGDSAAVSLSDLSQRISLNTQNMFKMQRKKINVSLKPEHVYPI